MSKQEKLRNIKVLENLLKEIATLIYKEHDIEELNINEYDSVFIKYSSGKTVKQASSLTKKDWELVFTYLSYTTKGKSYLHGKRLVTELPLLGSNEGHRFNGMLGDNSISSGVSVKKGISVSIRIFKKINNIKLRDFNVSLEIELFLKQRIKAKDNIFLSGATSSGKTTFLNLLIALIPKKERIISIEDIYELKIPHSNSVSLLPKDGNYDEILDFCMKSTPERLLLGELSTQNVHAVEKFITSGHKGFLMTMHAEKPRQAITDTFFAKFPSSQKQNTSYEKEAKLLAENIDLVIQLNHERKLTHLYFPKEDKEYIFKKDEESFLKERLNIKSQKEQK